MNEDNNDNDNDNDDDYDDDKITVKEINNNFMVKWLLEYVLLWR